MKKLLTIIVTLCIFFIGYSKSFAVGTVSIVPNTLRFGYENSLQQHTYSQVAFNDYEATTNISNYNHLEALTIYFSASQNEIYDHIVFSGTVGFSTLLDTSIGSFQNYLPDSISSIRLESNSSPVGACTLNSITENRQSSLIEQATIGQSTQIIYGVTFNWTADCRVDSSLLTGENLNDLQFYIGTPWQANEVHNTRVDFLINPAGVGYNGEYDDNLNSILNAIQNITINGATVNVDQTPVTNSIQQQTQDIINNQNNNNQQLIDQLTDETCTLEQCSNLVDISSFTSTTNHGITYNYNGQKVSLLGTADSTRNYNLLQGWNSNNYYLTGDYVFRVNQALPYDLTVSNELGCKLIAGQTSVVCHSSSGQHYYNPQFRSLPANSSLNITDLEVFLSSNLTQDFCTFGSNLEICTGSNKLDNINDTLQQTQDYLTESPEQGISNAVSNIQRTLQDIEEEDSNYYLLDFVRLPLILLRNLNNGGMCQPIVLHLPYMHNQDLTIPCMRPIIEQYFGSLLNFYQGCITVFMSYWIFSKVYKLLKGFSDLNSNEAEQAI